MLYYLDCISRVSFKRIITFRMAAGCSSLLLLHIGSDRNARGRLDLSDPSSIVILWSSLNAVEKPCSVVLSTVIG